MVDHPERWKPAKWDDRPKHRPRKNQDWNRVVRLTGRPDEAARYVPALDLLDIRGLELGCVQERGIEFPSPKPHVRYYYWDTGRFIGASAGREVRHVYAEYHMDGSVHGRPITVGELRQKGAPL